MGLISTFLAFSTLVVVVSAGVQLENSNSAFQGCLAATSKAAGAPVVIHDCNTGDASNYDWDVQIFPSDPAPQQLKLLGTNLCLDVPNGANVDGTKLQLWTCTPGNTNQIWNQTNSIGTWQWVGTNKCIDNTNGALVDGNPIQIWTCDFSNRNQFFSGRTVPDTQTVTVTLEGGPDLSPQPRLCLTAVQNTDGARVSLAPCGSPSTTFPSGNATWVVPRANLNGILSTYGGTKCLDLRNGDSTNGNALQIWSCDAANPNQIWRVDALIPRGQAKVTRDGATKCLDIKDGNFAPGADIQIWDCDPSGNNLNQRWIARQQ